MHETWTHNTDGKKRNKNVQERTEDLGERDNGFFQKFGVPTETERTDESEVAVAIGADRTALDLAEL